MPYFIPGWCNEKIIMRWYQNASYVNGVWSFSNYTEKEIIASVQASTPSTRNLNPEGFDPRGDLVLFTTEPTIQLIQQGGQDSVFFYISGNYYYMVNWAKWNYLMNHWRIEVVSKNGYPS